MNPIPPIPPPTGESPHYVPPVPGGLGEIASAQKFLLWSLLATFVGWLLPGGVFVVMAFQLWTIFNMAKALDLPQRWTWVVGSLIPIVSLFVLLNINRKATNVLRLAGVRVGLMGANSSDLNRALQK